MQSGTAVVVMPVYKERMTGLEAMSLSRCAAVLRDHPLVFFGPQSLDFRIYQTEVPAAQVQTFPDRYFRSLGGYSELLVRPCFYEAFASYDFTLIYQLDAFVFEDQLLEWCARDYDYVGAPWLDPNGGHWMGVGNGGFSLRKVHSCLDVLHSRHKLDPRAYWSYVCRTTSSPVIRALKYHRKLLSHLGLASDVQCFLKKWIRRQEPEDMFWGLHAVRYAPSFRVAPVEEATKFAVEAGLENSCKYFTQRPPFGCHRSWFLEMLQRFLNGHEAPLTPYEALVWDLARVAGLERKSGRERSAGSAALSTMLNYS